MRKKIVVFATTLLLVATRLCAAEGPRPIPIVLDTDIGSDIDDAFALALILRSPELDLQAVTTVSGDTQARARLAAKMLWVAGRGDVPVAPGEPGAGPAASQTAWAEGFSSPSLLREPGVSLLKTKIEEGRGRVVVVAIGPLTNIAALMKQYPEVRKQIRQIVLMGGSFARGYSPGSGPTPEGNIASDVAAAQAVFSSGVPILMAPLDVTARLQLYPSVLQRVFAQSTPLSNALRAVYALWGQPTPTLHDPMAVSLLIDRRLARTRAMAVRVDKDGMTREQTGKPKNAVVGIETDAASYIDFFMRRMQR